VSPGGLPEGPFDFDAPRLFGYTPETAIAEKLEAMVVLDMANSRMKDFLDIWTLARDRTFAGGLLAQAIETTFRQRRTALPDSTPLALTSAFHSVPTKQSQWRAYLRKGRIQGDVPGHRTTPGRVGHSIAQN